MRNVGTFQYRSAVDRDANSPVCTCVKTHCECPSSPSRARLVLTATDSSGGHRTRDAQVICVVTSRKARREQDDSTSSSSISIAPAVFTPPALRHCMEGAERRLSSRVSQHRASSVEPCAPSLLPPCLNVEGKLSALHERPACGRVTCHVPAVFPVIVEVFQNRHSTFRGNLEGKVGLPRNT